MYDLDHFMDSQTSIGQDLEEGVCACVHARPSVSVCLSQHPGCTVLLFASN